MGCWYQIDGEVSVQVNAKTRKIWEQLHKEVSSDVELTETFTDKWTLSGKTGMQFTDKWTLRVSGGMQCSYTTASTVETLLEELSPYVVGEAARFFTKTDDDEGEFWLGSPSQIERAKRKRLVQIATEAAAALTPEEWRSLVAELATKPRDFWASVKQYYVLDRVGRARHVVNYCDGRKTHPDGSPFWDITICGNKKTLAQVLKDLKANGYTER